MKRLITIALFTLIGSNVFALTVAVSNVVTAYQSESQREAYTGRKGEVVHNTTYSNSMPLTVFYGTLGGARLIAAPDGTYYLYGGADEIANGAALSNLLSGADSGDVIYLNSATFDSGSYSFPDKKVTIIGEDPVYDKINMVHSNIRGIVGGTDTNAVLGTVLKSDDTVPVINALNRLTLKYIAFESDINFSVGSHTSILNCEIMADITGSFDGFIMNSYINGNIDILHAGSVTYSEFGPLGGVVLIKEGMTSELSNIWTQSSNTWVKSGRSGMGANIILDRSTIAANDLFSIGSTTGSSNPTICRDVEFVNTAGTWLIEPLSEFWNCKGVSSSITGIVTTIIGCLDENGVRITDKP